MKRRFYVTGFLLLLAFDTEAQIGMKLAAMGAQPLGLSVAWLLRLVEQGWLYGAVLGYVGAFAVWMTLLKHAPIGPAFAASHMDIASVLVVSHFIFNEPMNAAQAAGVSLILAGVACLAITEQGDPTPG